MDDQRHPLRPPSGSVRDYEIIDLLGKGGMAEVWRGRHIRLGRSVAIKFVASRHRKRGDIVERFRNEIDTLLRLEHPHIVTVYDTGETREGLLYLVMELLRGETLEELIRGFPDDETVDWHRLARITQQVCDALEIAHRHGIIHRDIKPSNIFCLSVGGRDFVKLLDFGIAKVCEELRHDDGAGPVTEVGTFIGTHHYAAPELIRPQEFGIPDARADIFALGVTLYLCATGTLPFRGLSRPAVLYKTCTETPPSPRERAPHREIPELLDAVITQAMALRPEERFESVLALREALTQALGPPTIPFAAPPSPPEAVAEPTTAEHNQPARNQSTAQPGRLALAGELEQTHQPEPRPPSEQPGASINLWVATATAALAAIIVLALSFTPDEKGQKLVDVKSLPAPGAPAEERRPRGVETASTEPHTSTSHEPSEPPPSVEPELPTVPEPEPEPKPKHTSKEKASYKEAVRKLLQDAQANVRQCNTNLSLTLSEFGSAQVIAVRARARGSHLKVHVTSKNTAADLKSCIEKALGSLTTPNEGRGAHPIVHRFKI